MGTSLLVKFSEKPADDALEPVRAIGKNVDTLRASVSVATVRTTTKTISPARRCADIALGLVTIDKALDGNAACSPASHETHTA